MGLGFTSGPPSSAALSTRLPAMESDSDVESAMEADSSFKTSAPRAECCIQEAWAVHFFFPNYKIKIKVFSIIVVVQSLSCVQLFVTPWTTAVQASLVTQTVENLLQCRRLGSIPGSGRSPLEGSGNPLQYSCLENSMDRGAWWATVHVVAESLDITEWLTLSLSAYYNFTWWQNLVSFSKLGFGHLKPNDVNFVNVLCIVIASGSSNRINYSSKLRTKCLFLHLKVSW